MLRNTYSGKGLLWPILAIVASAAQAQTFTILDFPGWVRLFWILRFTGYDGGFANAKAAYDSSFLLTSFSEPRRLRWDEVGANGTVSGTW